MPIIVVYMCKPVAGNASIYPEIDILCSSADIDECTEAAMQGTLLCENPNQRCQNNLGSYECLCPDGTMENTEGVCERE